MVLTGKHPHNSLMMLAYNSTIINLFFTLNSDIPEDVSSLREFTTAMIVAATSKCLRLIKDDLQIPSVLPASMSSKFRLGTTLATACQVCLVNHQSFTHWCLSHKLWYVWSTPRIDTFWRPPKLDTCSPDLLKILLFLPSSLLRNFVPPYISDQISC